MFSHQGLLRQIDQVKDKEILTLKFHQFLLVNQLTMRFELINLVYNNF